MTEDSLGNKQIQIHYGVSSNQLLTVHCPVISLNVGQVVPSPHTRWTLIVHTVLYGSTSIALRAFES